MKTVKLITSILFVLIISACTTDDNGLDKAESTTVSQDTEVEENPQTTENPEPSEEPASQPATEEDTTATQNTALAQHYYELAFSGGPLNGTTLIDSLAIGSGLAQYSDVEGPEVISIILQEGDFLFKGLLTRFNGDDSFAIIEEDQIQEQTAAHLLFSFVPPGPTTSVYASASGTLELSDLEIYTFQSLELASLKIVFNGSFNYVAPPNEAETVEISGTIIIGEHTFSLPNFDIPN